jgi:hypothetical protein
MTTTMSGALMGLANRLAAEMENLAEQTTGKKVTVSARVDGALALRLKRGSIATGETESRLLEQCLMKCLDDVVRDAIQRRNEAAAEFDNPGNHRGTRPAPEIRKDVVKLKGRKN